MTGNTLFLGNKIFEIPPFFQTRPGDLGKKGHACSLRFSALKDRPGLDDDNATSLKHGNKAFLDYMLNSVFVGSK